MEEKGGGVGKGQIRGKEEGEKEEEEESQRERGREGQADRQTDSHTQSQGGVGERGRQRRRCPGSLGRPAGQRSDEKLLPERPMSKASL